MMTTAAQNLANLHRAIDAWNAGDLDGYLDVYDDGVRLHGYAPEPMDKTGVRDFYSMILRAFPGSQLTLDEELVDGERVALRFTQRGVHEGEFMGLAATGRAFALTGQTVLHFAHGRVIERWSTADMLGLLGQLGAMPAPPG
jgi:predicted ester cyclase